jgi:hypothetical protein
LALRMLSCRMGCFSFEAQKKQNACQQRGFLRTGLSRTSCENLGCNFLPCCRSLLALPFCKNCNALQPHWPPLFSALLAEAFLLTGEVKDSALPTRHWHEATSAR